MRLDGHAFPKNYGVCLVKVFIVVPADLTMFLNLRITIHLLSIHFAIPFFILFPFVFVELPQYCYLIKLSVDVSGSNFLTLTSA